MTWVSFPDVGCDESRNRGRPRRLILSRSTECLLAETDVTFIDSPSLPPTDSQPTGESKPSVDPLALITHPERAIDAARRMEANCRSGLRFYSDFRRVRALDEVPVGDDPFDAFDDPAYPAGADFDPAFSRRF